MHEYQKDRSILGVFGKNIPEIFIFFWGLKPIYFRLGAAHNSCLENKSQLYKKKGESFFNKNF